MPEVQDEAAHSLVPASVGALAGLDVEEKVDIESAFLYMTRSDFDRAQQACRIITENEQFPVSERIEASVHLGCIFLFLEQLDQSKLYFQAGCALETENIPLQEWRSLWHLVLIMYEGGQDDSQFNKLALLIKAKRKEDISGSYQIQLDIMERLLDYRNKKNYSLHEKANLNEDLEKFISELKKKLESGYTPAINDMYIIIGLGLIAIKEIDNALHYFEKVKPLIYSRRGDGSIEFKIDANKDKRHFLYYLHQSKDKMVRRAYAECIESSFKGLYHYPHSKKLVTFLDQNVARLLHLVLTGGEGYEAALQQLAALVESKAYLTIIGSLPEHHRVSLCRDLFIYLGSQTRFYEAQQLARTLNVSSNSALNQALRYEQAGNCAFFYEELKKADEYYQKAIAQYDTDKTCQRFALTCLIQRYIIALALNNMGEISPLKESILSLSKIVFPKEQEQKKVSDFLEMLASDEVEPIDIPIMLGDSMLLEQKGLILFFRRQYERSRQYFIDLRMHFQHSSSIDRWNTYIARIWLKTRASYAKPEDMLDLDFSSPQEVLAVPVDIALLKLKCKVHYEGQLPVPYTLYGVIKALRARYAEYEPIEDEYEKISRRYAVECQEKFLAPILDALIKLKLPQLKNLFDPKQLEETKKHLLGVMDTFFMDTPAFQEELLHQRIEEKATEHLTSILSRKMPESSTGLFAAKPLVSLHSLGNYLKAALCEWRAAALDADASESKALVALPDSVEAFSVQQAPVFKPNNSKWTDEQNQFYDALRECLNDEFTVARFIADGRVVYPDNQHGFEAVETLALAGTQMPGLSSVSVGIGLALKTVKLALAHKNEVSAISVAKKIKDFAGSNNSTTWYLADQMAHALTHMFGDQINKLTRESLLVLSQSLATLMITYIATDLGKNTTLGSWLYEGIADSMRSMYNKLFSSAAPQGVSFVQRDKRILLLQCLFCKNLTSKTGLVLKDPEVNVQHPWFVEEMLMYAGIRSNDGLCYFSKENEGHLIYGFRRMPNDLARTMAEQFNYSFVADAESQVKAVSAPALKMMSV